MKLIKIRGYNPQSTKEIAAQIGNEFLNYSPDASVLVFENTNKINLDNKEIEDFIPWWEEMIAESINSLGFLDSLNLAYADDSLEISKQAYYSALKKIFSSYQLVLVNSNNFSFNDTVVDNKPMLVVVETDEASIDFVEELEFSENAFLVLKKEDSEALAPNARDKIAEINLKLIAKYEDSKQEQFAANTKKILNILELV